MGVGDQRHAPAALPPWKDPVTPVQEAGWAPGPVWTGTENLASTGLRFPDDAARRAIPDHTEQVESRSEGMSGAVSPVPSLLLACRGSGC
jgi:hypothetical protein